MTKEIDERAGGLCYLILNSYAGVSKTLVQVIGKTPKKYRIRAVQQTKLGGRNRWLQVGETALVPKHAVGCSECATCLGKGEVPTHSFPSIQACAACDGIGYKGGK